MVGWAAFGIWSATSGSAWAACPSPYAIDGLLADLSAAEGALKSSDNAGAGAAAGRLEAGLPCLAAALPRAIAGRAYRAIGGGLAVADDPRGAGWLRTAAELEPSFVYGLEDLPAEHPVRGLYDAAKDQAGGEPTGTGTLLGTAWLDGRKVTVAEARAGRPHLFQQDLGSGLVGVVIDGAAFPPEGVEKGTVARVEPEPNGQKPPKPARVAEPKPGRPDPEPRVERPQPAVASGGTIKRKRPWEKTPLIVGGAVIGVAGGALYGLSAASAAAAANATNLADLDAKRQSTNTMFVASLAVVGVGVGTLTWGAILDGGTPMPAFTVRF